TATASVLTTADDFEYEIVDGEITIVGYKKRHVDNIVVPASIDGLSVTAIGTRAFCESSAKSFVLPNSLKTIGYASFSLSTVKTIAIPEGVTYIDEMAFMGCHNLTNVTLPSTLEIIEKSAFEFCDVLTEIHIPAKVTTIGQNAFNITLELESFSVDPQNTVFCSNDDVLYSKDMSVLYAYPALKQGASFTVPQSVSVIEEAAFRYNAFLQEVLLPYDLQTVKDYAFSEMERIQSVIFQGECAEFGARVFYDCDTLEKAVLPQIDKIPGATFRNCKNLKEFQLPGNVTAIENEAFWGCENLPAFDMPTDLTIVGSEAFYRCANFETVVFGDKLLSIGDKAFYACNHLNQVIIASSQTTLGTSCFGYGENSFKNSDLVISSTPYSDAKRYADNNGFGFLVIDGSGAYFYDQISDISVLTEEVLPSGVVFIAQRNVVNERLDEFSVSLEVDGQPYAITKPVTLKVPVSKTLRYPYIALELVVDGVATPIEEYTVKKDSTTYLTFETTQLGQFQIKAVPPAFMYGDCDLDGFVNAADALLILKNVVGKEFLNQEQEKAADVDSNKVVNATDALIVLK
ncbi:MAG: leucine-rich repeat protein, partial [Clostridia bacterium]|nr:leucine-rich repeat protein [Clostridia bacterium]